MSRGLLSGLSVLDLSDSIAGQFASRIMADHGAWVALVEPPAGSAVRRMAPFRPGGSGESLLFWHLNGGKQSLSLDPWDADRWPELLALCRQVDVVLTGDRELAERLNRACPEAVVGVVTDFGPEGPYAAWQGSELIFQALSGSMHINGSADREPLYGVGQRVSYAAGLWLYIGVLAALCGRLRHGDRYSPVEVTLHEAAAAMEENFSVRWAYSGEQLPPGGDPFRSVSTYQCADGWATVFLRSGGSQWQSICEIVGAPELAEDPRFADWSLIFKNWSAAREELNRHTRRMPVAALIAACEKSDIVAAAVETAATLRVEPHLAERNYWQVVTTSSGDRLNLGPLFRIPAAPAIRDRGAPEIGGGDQVPPRAARMGAMTSRPAGADAPLPLSGTSVLDFTTAWAGPMATKILAHLGADVIKMEGPLWYDSWRGLPNPTKRTQYPGGEPGARPYNRCALFNAQNQNKRGLVLDLKSERGREIIRAMVPRIDCVVANFRPGALARQGLSFEALTAINPTLSMIEMPAVGTGPFAHRIGLGPTMEAMAGITGLIGYPGGRPMGSQSSYMDPMGGLHGAAASLTALYHRLAVGKGTYIEVAQREAAMQWIGEILLEALESERNPPLMGNAVGTACPHNAFPTDGNSGWIAIAAFDDAQWLALCEVLGRPEWVNDPRFLHVGSRIAHERELNERIAGATAARDRFVLSRELQAAGVPAAPVLNGRELFEDPQLRAGGWYTALTHAEAGTHEYPGFPPRLSGVRYRPLHAAPRFGEHTAEVLAEYAGLSSGELAALAATGVTSDSPISGKDQGPKP